MSNPCASIISILFEARTKAHMFHLTTSSYAVHMALQDFYEKVVDLADAFAEGCIGVYGPIESFPRFSLNSSDALTMLKKTKQWVRENRSCCEDSELQNQIDEILSLFNSTIYKLTQLQ